MEMSGRQISGVGLMVAYPYNDTCRTRLVAPIWNLGDFWKDTIVEQNRGGLRA
ncbi:unnamed protein product [Dovyalis caffra]|uniref:Uncharacterized protein n=1 Tax=Dovyalis caffra TaxID=77055 RepID=A0AAV1RNK2_9ROSI|nr:unnamed protein product [Dovyalis caffra]